MPIWKAGENEEQRAEAVSYTHLDVYKRQPDITTFYGWDAEIENVQAKAK